MHNLTQVATLAYTHVLLLKLMDSESRVQGKCEIEQMIFFLCGTPIVGILFFWPSKAYISHISHINIFHVYSRW